MSLEKIGHCPYFPYIFRKSHLNQIHVITCSPGYPALTVIARYLGCDIDHWKAKYTKHGWKFELVDLEALINPSTKLLIVNFPHNPTGYCPSPEDYKVLVEFCRSHGIFLFCDEMYLLSNYEGDEKLPSACQWYDDCVCLFGMSKTFAQPGLRLGWLVSKNKEIIALMMRCKDYFSQCCPAASEILSIISLRNIDSIIASNMAIVWSNLKILGDFFNEYPDLFEWYRPKGATVTLVKVKGWLLKMAEGKASDLCEILYKQADVMLIPGELFGTDIEDKFVRFGFGKTDMKEGLNQLRNFIERHKPQK